MKHNAVIYDREYKYAVKLAYFMNASDTFPFETRAFPGRDEVEKYCSGNDSEILILDEEYEKLADSIRFKELIILSDKSTREESGTFYVYKYQNVEKIIREIVSYLSKSDNLSAVIKRKHRMKIISFYSPVKRTLATTLAVGMGQNLGRRNRTIYINLECYSGLDRLLGKNFEKDITDLLYFMERNGGNISMMLSGIVEHIDDVDILPPIKNQADLAALGLDKWINLLKQIEQDTDYEYVILDLCEAVQGLNELLLMSDKVITCVENDEIAINKIVQYEESLKEAGYDQIIDNTKKCNVPHFHRRNVELKNLNTGEMGEYIQKLVQGLADEK